jgi:hypothetical protein
VPSLPFPTSHLTSNLLLGGLFNITGIVEVPNPENTGFQNVIIRAKFQWTVIPFHRTWPEANSRF